MNATDIETALRSAGLPVLPQVTGGADWSVDHAYRIRSAHGAALFLTNDGDTFWLVWRRTDADGEFLFQFVREGSLALCIGAAGFALSPAEFGPWEIA